MKDALFYFANLAVDVGHCVSALQKGDSSRYEIRLAEAYKTLTLLRGTKNASAYEEGQLLIRGLEYARELCALSAFNAALDNTLIEYSPLVQ